MARRQRVLLGFDERHGDRLGLLTDANAEGIVSPSASTAPSLAADDLDRPEGRFAADQVLGPALRVDGGVNQFRSGICLRQGHGDGSYRRPAEVGLQRLATAWFCQAS